MKEGVKRTIILGFIFSLIAPSIGILNEARASQVTITSQYECPTRFSVYDRNSGWSSTFTVEYGEHKWFGGYHVNITQVYAEIKEPPPYGFQRPCYARTSRNETIQFSFGDTGHRKVTVTAVGTLSQQ